MTTKTIAMICAGLGVLGSIVWSVAGYFGITTLRDIRNELRSRSAR